MDALFWFGLILGGLVGAAFDLWKRPLDRLLDRRLDQRSASRVDTIAAQIQGNSQRLRDYLVEVVLQTTLVGSLVGILAGIVYGFDGGIGAFFHPSDSQSLVTVINSLNVVGQAISVIGAAYIVRMASDALAVARRINPTVVPDDPQSTTDPQS